MTQGVCPFLQPSGHPPPSRITEAVESSVGVESSLEAEGGCASLADAKEHGRPIVGFDGAVYDLDRYRAHHPPGKSVIDAHAGRDITELFLAFHSDHARDILEHQKKIGVCPEGEGVHSAFGFLGAAVSSTDRPLPGFTIFDAANGRVTYALERERSMPDRVESIHEAFRSWIKDDASFPCIAGKIAVGQASYGLGVYDHPVGDPRNTESLLEDLNCFMRYQSEQWRDGNHFTTYIAVFPEGGSDIKSEAEFQRKLRTQLHLLKGANTDARARLSTTEGSSEVQDSEKRDYLVVGLSPVKSRKSRQFEYPALVFNAKRQFEHLRATDQMDSFKAAIRRRDQHVSGSIDTNPLLDPIQLDTPMGRSNFRRRDRPTPSAPTL